jgi:hypothetical protein
MVVAALAFAAGILFLFKPRSKRGLSLTSAICSKWQPTFFIFLCIKKIVLKALDIGFGVERAGLCSVSLELRGLLHAALCVWNVVIFLMGISTLCCDLDADFDRTLRVRAYALMALCLTMDAVGSIVWGNATSSDFTVSFEMFKVLADNETTSCIVSQAIIVAHFLYVSYRSHNGRGWAYASLRFELDECGKAAASAAASTQLTNRFLDPLECKAGDIAMLEACAAAADSSSSSSSTCTAPCLQAWQDSCGVFSRVYRIWLQFQKRAASRSRVYVIPCSVNDERASKRDPAVTAKRPAFHLKCLRPLQRLADRYPIAYFTFVFGFVAVPNIALNISLRSPFQKDVIALVLNTIIVTCCMGFLSCKRYNLDKFAVKHVALSFRFLITAALLLYYLALQCRRMYIGQTSPMQPVAIALLLVFFFQTSLFECSPHFPPLCQFLATVIDAGIRYAKRMSCDVFCAVLCV